MAQMGKIKVSEAQFASAVMDLAIMCGWRIVHFKPAIVRGKWMTFFAGHKGFPDLALARDGVVILAELKVKPNKLEPDQEKWGAAIGHEIWRVWYPEDMAMIETELRRKRG